MCSQQLLAIVIMKISSLPRVLEIADTLLEDIDISATIEAGQPLILRGAYKDKPLVKAGLVSDASAQNLISQYYSGKPLTSFIAPPEFKGRFFYNSDMTAMNFGSRLMQLDAFFNSLNQSQDSDHADAFYAGSTDIQTFFPDMLEPQALSLKGAPFEQYPPIVSLWMGNKTTAAIHYDMSHNIAACMIGRRRFTLFPPDQIENLYPGPISPTPAGQVVSMVDLSAPDFRAYPKFEMALSHAQIAELEPGDVLIYPALWWHQVDALARFNVLINYWWNEAPSSMDSPMNVILYSMMALRDRSPAEKAAWKHMFDYYIFGDPDKARAHIPDSAHGPLAPMDTQMMRQLRMLLLQKLNR